MTASIPTGPSSSRSAAGTASRPRCAPIRRYAASITAVVSVADDGGSSGRLRRDLGVLAARRPAPLPRRARRRRRCGRTRSSTASRGGELDGHALGNLVLVGLTETLGELPRRARRGRPPPRRGRPGAARHHRAGRAEGRDRRRRRDRPRVEGQVAVAEQHRHPPGRAGPGRRRAPPPRRSRRSPAPTRWCWRRARSTRASLPVLCVPGSGRAVAATRAGWSRWRTCGPSCPRPPASTPPTTCGRCSTTAPGSNLPLRRRRGARRRRRHGSGRWGSSRSRRRWRADRRARARSRTVGDGARRLCCSPTGVLNETRRSSDGGTGRDQRVRAHRPLVHRALLARGADAGVELVAVNDPMGDSQTMAFLLKHDSVGGTLPNEVKATDDGFSIDGQRDHASSR